jgi:histidinol-phosphate aminotransferase
LAGSQFIAVDRLSHYPADTPRMELSDFRPNVKAIAGLFAIPPVRVPPGATASFLLLHVADGPALRVRPRSRGIVVRPGDTLPSLGSDQVGVAVRDREWNERLLTTIRAANASASSSGTSPTP